MTSLVEVKPHMRKKPEKPAVYIETHARLRAEIEAKANADKTVNEFREQIGYAPGTNPLTVIIGALRVLSMKAKGLVI